MLSRSPIRRKARHRVLWSSGEIRKESQVPERSSSRNNSVSRGTWTRNPRVPHLKAAISSGSASLASLRRRKAPLPTSQQRIGLSPIHRPPSLNCDLVVIGAYGHTRRRKIVFGGATHTILRAMTFRC